VQFKTATGSITSIAANGYADVDVTLAAAFSGTPTLYLVQPTSSTTIIPLMVRSFSDSTHASVRLYNVGSSAATNYSFSIWIIAVS